MAKKSDNDGSLWLILIGVFIYGAYKLGDFLGWELLAIAIFTILGLMIWYKSVKKKKRREMLMLKYNDIDIVESVMNGEYWQGQTAIQLLDSLGYPHSEDKKVLKTKTSETWKYDHRGSNRYGLRVTLENDIVVGWNKK